MAKSNHNGRAPVARWSAYITEHENNSIEEVRVRIAKLDDLRNVSNGTLLSRMCKLSVKYLQTHAESKTRPRA